MNKRFGIRIMVFNATFNRSPDTILEEGHPRTIPPKVWLQLAQWFLKRRFLWEFPIGSYVKLSSAVAAIFSRCSEMPDTILEEDHPRIISAKFG